jgi:hypothetical protein
MNVEYDDVRTWFQLHRARERERRLAAWLFFSVACAIIEAVALVVLLVEKF